MEETSYQLKTKNLEHNRLVRKAAAALGFLDFKDIPESNGQVPLYQWLLFKFRDGKPSYIGGNHTYDSKFGTVTLDSLAEICVSKEITVRLNKDYAATVSKNGITVGCQRFDLDIVDQLASAVKEIRSE